MSDTSVVHFIIFMLLINNVGALQFTLLCLFVESLAELLYF